MLIIPRSALLYQKELPYPLLSDPKRAFIKSLGSFEPPKSTTRSHFIFEKGTGKLVEKKSSVKPAESYECRFVYPSSREHTTLTDRGFGSLFFLVSATLALEFIKKHHGSTGGDVAPQEQQEQLLGPRSVVVDNRLLEEWIGPWFELTNSNKAAQLHRKFWRKSMVSEEAEWRETRKPVGDDPGDGEVNPMDEQEKGKGKEEEEEEEEEEEFGPGCYILNIDIDNLPHPKIWIRAEYIRIYDRCSAHYESCLSQPNRNVAPSVVITGQPGIAKPSFLVRY